MKGTRHSPGIGTNCEPAVAQILLPKKDDCVVTYLIAQDYTEQFAQTRNEEAVRDMRRVLTERGCHHYEIPIIMNLMPETAEEAIKLSPSLKDPARFPDDSLDQMLEEIIHYRQFQ
ncbi:hypothetical protein DUNSADRAFT_13345 [Dunaliella salina]|uniref:RNA polymerase Rpb4/RPC9 core domain-containing protein n=1 Tax=Dunaliella salina TaxID=3046 RepID=A0ABQ7G9L9_DUNSA|nr:hypothetical protein DUNSADRAFT_13345 [Dunaliella salina]|eukprot:KAF5831289.1 hypothetical protein DUNSADRAFT_13345 [Dunaliella salina]